MGEHVYHAMGEFETYGDSPHSLYTDELTVEELVKEIIGVEGFTLKMGTSKHDKR
ncbi:MAG: hypothetical protein QW514_06640 [Thermoprotei archaeon]